MGTVLALSYIQRAPPWSGPAWTDTDSHENMADNQRWTLVVR